MGKGWSKERREAAAARCRAQKPWEKSTGPKTPKGKMRSSLNALKHGDRCAHFQHARKMLKLNREFFKNYKAVYTIDIVKMKLANELITFRDEYGYNPLENNDPQTEQGGPPL